MTVARRSELQVLAAALAFLPIAPAASGAPIRALIVDGKDNHAWQQPTPVLKKIVEDAGRFTVDVATAPPKGGRQSGPEAPIARWRDGRQVLDTTEGPCGRHGARKPFPVEMRDPEHPIAKGLPTVWMHAADELYNHLFGPARELTILGTAEVRLRQ